MVSHRSTLAGNSYFQVDVSGPDLIEQRFTPRIQRLVRVRRLNINLSAYHFDSRRGK